MTQQKVHKTIQSLRTQTTHILNWINGKLQYKRTIKLLLICFLFWQSADLFKYLGWKFSPLLNGVRYGGTRYDITINFDSLVWYTSVFFILYMDRVRIYELEPTKDNKDARWMFPLLWLDMLIIMNKPFGWVGWVPICTDLFVGLSLVWIIFKDKIKS